MMESRLVAIAGAVVEGIPQGQREPAMVASFTTGESAHTPGATQEGM